jgi:DNA-binding CsgD family transcriptional regulator/tetratricopeptide (TPR) repeat protein
MRTFPSTVSGAERVGDVLLERSEQLATLAGALASVEKQRQGRVAFVAGEAGAGKTALLRRFVEDRSERVLWGACDALHTPRPLGAFLDVARATGNGLQDVVAGGGKPHEVAGALMRELSDEAPRVLVLEDVHWADEATLDVLRLVGRRIETVPALLVASYRDDELGRSHPLRIVLGELPAGDAVMRLRVPCLTAGAVAVLAESCDVDADALYRKTDGNPFYVTEILAAGGRELPETVRDAVLARAARLGESARALLDAVAILPGGAELWLLDAVSEAAPERLEECLQTGVLVWERDGVAFRHELARLVIEESIPPDRRVALHRRALTALADPPVGVPDFSRLAHHAESAADADAILRYAPAAAEHASSLGAHREAEAQYGLALRFGDRLSPEERADLLEQFADEGYLTDMRDPAIDALQEAVEIHRARGDLRREGEALRLLARLLVCPGRNVEARAAAMEAVAALEQLPPGRELARAYSMLSHVSMLASAHEETIAWGSRAIELAERTGDTEALVNALNNVGVAEANRGIPGGVEKLERSRELAERAGLSTDVGRAYINLCALLAHRREWALADSHLPPGIEYCRANGLEAWLHCLIAIQAESELAQARWTEAADTATALLDLQLTSSLIAPRMNALVVLALVRARRGDPEYWPLLDEARELAESSGDLQMVANVAAPRAEALWLEGKLAEIAEETQSAYDLAVERAEPRYLGELACWRRRAGVLPDPPFDVSEPYKLQLAGDWAAAADMWRSLGCPYEAALALADADADEPLRHALDQLQQIGARPAAAIVAHRLRERGVRGLPRGPRSSTRENPAGLTGRELEVLALLAEGLRNADIAERLVLSPKTIDHHVSAILRKLHVTSRRAAGAEAARLGLLSPS